MIKNLTKFLKILFIIILFFLFIDITVGKYVYKKFIVEQIIDKDNNFGKYDEVYDHKFVANLDVVGGFGSLRHRLCTDNNSFKSSCNAKEKKLNFFDIAFIGDSFTEAVGYDYEKSFVGIIDQHLKKKRIANMGMTSYSPSIYYTMMNKFITDGYKFKEVIVFLDLSDLVDDVLCYQVQNNKRVKRRDTFTGCYKNFNKQKKIYSKFIEKNFKFTNLIYEMIIYEVLKKENYRYIDIINHSRSEWSYNYNKNNFNNLEFKDAINISKKNMENLYLLLKKNSIELSVAVYPWPGTLKYDIVDNSYVKVWEEFCLNKCKKFYNLMPHFFYEVNKNNFRNIYKKFYIENDVHFNSKGNKFLAEKFLLQYNN